MKPITVTELRGNIYNLLEDVLNTGVPLEVIKGGKRLLISPAEPVDKFATVVTRPNAVTGDPDDLVHTEWEIDFDLP